MAKKVVIVESERIEFWSDGVQDSLTHALAPRRFQEILSTELLKAHRSNGKLTLVSANCTLFSSRDDDDVTHSREKADSSLKREIEEELKSFADSLSQLLRSGDEIGRLSENGFWILIHGDRSATEITIQRFRENINQEIWQLQICEIESGESVKNLLRRMDAIHFAR